MSSSAHRAPGAAAGVGRPRHFTLAQANRALVLVRRIVADVVESHRRFLCWQESYEAAEICGHWQKAHQAREGLVRAGGRIRACLEELEHLGAELKDWSLGIVDFPCRAGGREVRLCWRWGERLVCHWHEADEGFASRRTVDSLPGRAGAPRAASGPVSV
jgi:hypothetical protein